MKEKNIKIVPAAEKFYSLKQHVLDFEKYKEIPWGYDRKYIFNEGDIVYFYYSNLADGSSRIIARGTVTKEIRVNNENILKSKYIVNFGNLKFIELNNKDFLKNRIKAKQCPTFLKEEREEDKQVLLELQNCNITSFTTDKYEEYFGEYNRCSYCFYKAKKEIQESGNYTESELIDKTIKKLSKYKIRTFEKTDGFNYLENHHIFESCVTRKLKSVIKKIIEESSEKEIELYLSSNNHQLYLDLMEKSNPINYIKNKKKNDVEIIEDLLKENNIYLNLIEQEFNIIRICPVCHGEFHHAKNRELLINDLYKNYYEDNLENYMNNDSEKILKVIKVLEDLYNIEINL